MGFAPTCAVRCIVHVQGFLCPSDYLQGDGLGAHHLGAQGASGDTGTDVLPGLEAVLPVEKDRKTRKSLVFVGCFLKEM